MSYFGDMAQAVGALWQGLRLTARHLRAALGRPRLVAKPVTQPDYFTEPTGIATLNYPYESLPVPDNGRYRLHNEMDDCIVCDKCAKVCPVDCIDIEPIKATEQVGVTSDGTPVRLYAAKFDIDMAKCCYCGLCTTVCPTECLTMTKVYDYSEFDLINMVYHFGNLTPEEADAKKQAAEAKKAAPKPLGELLPPLGDATGSQVKSGEEMPPPAKPRPVFKRPLPPATDAPMEPPGADLANQPPSPEPPDETLAPPKPKPRAVFKRPTPPSEPPTT
jgi:NADH-quinone oxidoreductase subunit I